jgi:hypothetical protein
MVGLPAVRSHTKGGVHSLSRHSQATAEVTRPAFWAICEFHLLATQQKTDFSCNFGWFLPK